MKQKKFGRRRFLGSAATSVIGVAGGLAAIDTASASSGISGTVSVRSSSSDWEYWVGLTSPRPDGPTVEKLPKADDHDEILLGTSAHGHVYEGGVDKYSFGDQITSITAHHKGADASLIMNIGEDSFSRRVVDMYTENSYFSYLFTVDNVDADGDSYPADIDKGLKADDNDSVSGAIASGFLNADKADNYLIVGFIDSFTVYDPYSGGSSEGISVVFNRD